MQNSMHKLGPMHHSMHNFGHIHDSMHKPGPMQKCVRKAVHFAFSQAEMVLGGSWGESGGYWVLWVIC